MRKIWLISVLAFVFMAMAACASMYYKGERVFRARGTVAAYEPGKMIKLQPGFTEMEIEGDAYVAPPPNAQPPVFEYAIIPDTEVKGNIKPGIRVLIRYTKVGSGDTAQKTARSIDAVWSK